MQHIAGISELQLQFRVRNYNHRFPGRITVEQLVAIIAASGCRCCWCGKENLHGPDLTIEHLEPRNDPVVLAVACFSCNSSHRVGFKGKQEVTDEIREYRKAHRWRAWEANHPHLVRMMRAAEYLRNKATRQRYIEANREHITAERKRYREEKRDVLNAKRAKWELENREYHAEQRKEWREANPDVVKQRWAEYSEAHRQELNQKAAERAANRDADLQKRAEYLAKRKAAYQANAEQRRADAKAYVEAHREEINAKKREKRAALKAAASATGSPF